MWILKTMLFEIIGIFNVGFIDWISHYLIAHTIQDSKCIVKSTIGLL